MSRSAENQAWAILAQHRYATETMQVMHYLTIQTMQAFPQCERALTADVKEMIGTFA